MNLDLCSKICAIICAYGRMEEYLCSHSISISSLFIENMFLTKACNISVRLASQKATRAYLCLPSTPPYIHKIRDYMFTSPCTDLYGFGDWNMSLLEKQASSLTDLFLKCPAHNSFQFLSFNEIPECGSKWISAFIFFFCAFSWALSLLIVDLALF